MFRLSLSALQTKSNRRLQEPCPVGPVALPLRHHPDPRLLSPPAAAEAADPFCSLVDAVLVLRSSTHIGKFHLDLPHLPPKVESRLASWLWFATACRVKDLRLELPRSEKRYPVLRSIRDCPSLVELRLCGGRVGLESSSGVISWASLRVLSMAYLRLTDDEMRGGSRGQSRARDGVEAGSVAEAELNFSMRVDPDDRFDYYKWPRKLARGILQKLRNATKFIFGCWYLQVLSRLEERDLPPLLPNCKSLILNTRCRSWERHCILNMIESSPQVERLIIKMVQPFWKSGKFDMDFEAFAYGTQKYLGPLKRKNKLECLDWHLRRVDVVRFDPRDHRSSSLLGLVEFILKEARVLDRMLINACKVEADGSNSTEAPDPRKLLEVSQSVLRHQRASKNAQVVLYYD
ncbi:hypothetical protein NL676_018873 [Syzygium grande]|nr:hypothetical protein NL676_018873 [Syzygium grande]